MKSRWILTPVLSLTALLALGTWAEGPPRIGTPGKVPRIDLGKRLDVDSPVRRSSAQRGARLTGRQGAGNVRLPSRSPGAIARPGVDLGGISRDLDRYPLAGLLDSYLREEFRGGYYDPHRAVEAQADAYRDAAIANAIVNVIGILATSQQPRPVAVAGPPEAPIGPRGHIERQRVLVQEGRTEEYQVWVPEHVIPETGEVVAGHHETRRREVAPVYEDREVWIPAP